MSKSLPNVGDKLYLRQFTSDYYIDMVKRPYTVELVTPTKVFVRACELIYPIFRYSPNTMSDYYKQFDGRRVCFFDTLPEEIVASDNGKLVELTWHSKRGMWGTKEPDRDFPQYAIFGEYEYFPYLN